MEVTIAEELLGNIPALTFTPHRAETAPTALVLLFHRYTASKELDANLGYMLARAGYTVVCPEADMHGSRFNGDEQRRKYAFWHILQDSLDAVPQLVADCQQRGLGDTHRVGVFGTSMGGFVALGAMRRYPWIRAGAAYMSSGYVTQAIHYIHPPLPAARAACMAGLRDYDITDHESLLGNRPLFLWHGEEDNVVPVAETTRLRDCLTQQGQQTLLQCVIDPHAGHKVNQNAVTAGIDFFNQHLPCRCSESAEAR